MIRLFDRVRTADKYDMISFGLPAHAFASTERTVKRSEIKASTVVSLDNVAEMYENQYLPPEPKPGREVKFSSVPDLEFFPKCVSPFDIAFYEFPVSKRHFRTVWYDDWRAPMQVGFCVAREEKHHRFVGFLREGSRLLVIAEGVWDTNEEGKLDGDLMVIPAGLNTIPGDSWDRFEGFVGFVKLLSVVGLGMSLMHCKNVTMLDSKPDVKLSKAFERRHDLPLVSYKTLRVSAMSSIGKRTEGLESGDLSKRLHICRGHFKDYSKTGLFGKRKGVYWWDQHARGDADLGAVVKDYEVAAK